MFSNKNFENLAHSGYIVYLQISPKYFATRAKFSGDNLNNKELNDICFTDRDKLYVEKSDIVLNCSTFKEPKAVKKLIKAVTKLIKKVLKEQN